MGSHRFLLLEDEPLVSDGLARWLRRERLGVPVVATTTAHARSLLRDGASWAGLVLDVVLRDGSGLDLLADARADAHPTTPAVFLTGYANPDWINRAFALGARYLVKPAGFDAIRGFFRDAVSVVSFSSRVELAARQWRTMYRLSEAESDVLRRSAMGQDRRAVALGRGTSELTVKRQVANLLRMTGDASMHAAVERLLRELVSTN